MFYPGVKTFFNLIFFLISSWVLIHVFGFLGIFLAFAYPVWWFFAPQQLPCLICQTRKNSTWCPLCSRKIDKSLTISPSSLRSVMGNSLLIFFISLISLGFIFVEQQVLTRSGIIPKTKTASFIIPTTGEYKVGQTFPMEIKINDISTTINAVQADIKFDPAVLEAIEVSTDKSFANIFVQKDINNELGYVRLSGGLPNPGFSGESGVFGTIYFRGKSTGAVRVNFLESSLVLANDGHGSNILKDLAFANYLIIPSDPGEIFPNMDIQLEIESAQAEDKTTQIALYQESNVLGLNTETLENATATAEPSEKPARTGFNFFEILGQIDHAILELWRKIWVFD